MGNEVQLLYKITKPLSIMTATIKSVPTLKGKVAEDFVEKAELSAKSKGSVNFSKQVKSATDILNKSDI